MSLYIVIWFYTLLYHVFNSSHGEFFKKSAVVFPLLIYTIYIYSIPLILYTTTLTTLTHLLTTTTTLSISLTTYGRLMTHTNYYFNILFFFIYFILLFILLLLILTYSYLYLLTYTIYTLTLIIPLGRYKVLLTNIAHYIYMYHIYMIGSIVNCFIKARLFYKIVYHHIQCSIS